MLSVTRADGSAERQTLELLRSRSGEVDRKVPLSSHKLLKPSGRRATQRYGDMPSSSILLHPPGWR